MSAALPAPAKVMLQPVVMLDGSGVSLSLVGGKAAALDRLIRWGVHVPPTAVVTAEAFRRVLEQPALQPVLRRISSGEAVDAVEIDGAFVAAGLPTDVLEQVCTAARKVSGGHRLVIRSSATVEDMAHSSFAGQYRSMLDVDASSPDALARAVLQVFASLWYPAPRAYREALGIGDADISMAAVMMPMIDAQRAGVVFTLDPTEVVATLRIEVVAGQGEALVSGRSTPSVTQVRRNADGTVDGELSDELRSIVRTALDIERLAGVAQDIEWAWDGELWIVQARPVTASRTGDQDPFDDDPVAVADVEFTTEGIGEMLPDVLPPLIWQASTFVVEEGFRTMLQRLGADLSAASEDRWLVRRVTGRAAVDVGRLTALMAGIPGAEQRLRSAYGIARDDDHCASARAVLRRDLLRHAIEASRARRRAVFDAEVVVHAVEEIDATAFECSNASESALRARLLALVSLAARAMAAELTMSADAGAILSAVDALLARWLPPAEAARWAALVTTPAVRAAPSPRSSAAVFAGPTWQELRLDPMSHSLAIEREDPFGELLRVLQSSPRWPPAGLRRRLTRRRLEHLVARASTQFEHRERTKAAILAIGGDVRRIHLEFGERLVTLGALSTRDDVVFLSIDEAEGVLRSPDRDNDDVDRFRMLLEDRRRWHRHHLTEDPLPARWRGVPTRHAVKSDGDGPLIGWSVSGGRFIGRARRVSGPQDPITKDEVLVAAATDPSWTPVLLRCGALVIERGGPLSHAAILAREFGLPAVFNVPDAVERLAGRRILVDGDAGTVEILDDQDTDEVIR